MISALYIISIRSEEKNFQQANKLIHKRVIYPLDKPRYSCRNVCDYVRNNLGIEIYSHKPETENTSIEYVAETKSQKDRLYTN